jgi:hypothetical protein
MNSWLIYGYALALFAFGLVMSVKLIVPTL